MQLTVHNAEIHTATVEVKTLTISGKQLTLSVFRQLPLMISFGDTGQRILQEWASGEIELWGRVRYAWDDASREADEHVVLTQYGALVRAYIKWPDGTFSGTNPDGERLYFLITDLPQLFIAV